MGKLKKGKEERKIERTSLESPKGKPAGFQKGILKKKIKWLLVGIKGVYKTESLNGAYVVNSSFSRFGQDI